ncbi:MAG TPA: phenylalanine--tRNA ligase beta subunit-related protein [bacterium]|nr:phenylalanine--tRNA ligase beta subunit-related protein [bacterium]
MFSFAVDPSVAEHVRIGLVEVRSLLVRPEDPILRDEIAAVAGAVRDRYAGREPAQIEGLQPARDLYKGLGVDPTRLRPSSEALLRRVLRGEALPAINTLVDTNNLCSLDFLLPIGLHDLDAVRGALTMRRGRPLEGYEGIGKAYQSVEGRLVVADGTGACGSPTSDSVRTMITPSTAHALMVIYAPGTYLADQMTEHTRVAGERILRFSAGRLVGTAVLP